MLVIGIDPGAQGGVAVGDHKEVHTVELLKDVGVDWLKAVTDKTQCHVFLEKAQAMPKQGVTSMFNYGVGFGTILGWLEALKLPHTLITPKEWTKRLHVGCTGESAKDKSLVAARRLFPTMKLTATDKSRVPHMGIVDALLICEYGRREFFR